MLASPETLQVWQVPILPLGSSSDLLPELTEEEQSRATRYRVPGAAEQFIQSRVALRRLLGETLGVAPRDLEFGLSPRGKPFLRKPKEAGLEFSVAHCRSLALIALQRGAPVGIDVEPLDTSPEAVAAVREILHPAEMAFAESMEASSRAGFFLQRWVGREAFAKATGVGLGGLDTASITWDFGSPQPPSPAREGRLNAVPLPVPVRVRGRSAEGEDLPGDWWLRPLELDSLHVAALVTIGSDAEVIARTWRWERTGT